MAGLVWAALGDPDAYCEPFAGSLAVLLARPGGAPPRHSHGETVNDADGMIVNFWRAARSNAAEVAEWAMAPPHEVTYAAIRAVNTVDVERLRSDPDWFDAEAAGRWLHIACWAVNGKPHATSRPAATGEGLAAPGCDARPEVAALAARLAHVRLLCGDWSRAVTPRSLYGFKTGTVGLFVDPPYDHALRDSTLYAVESSINDDVTAWCHEAAGRGWRVVLAGLRGEYDLPGWRRVKWTTARKASGTRNADRERLWLSPACLPVDHLVV